VHPLPWASCEHTSQTAMQHSNGMDLPYYANGTTECDWSTGMEPSSAPNGSYQEAARAACMHLNTSAPAVVPLPMEPSTVLMRRGLPEPPSMAATIPMPGNSNLQSTGYMPKTRTSPTLCDMALTLAYPSSPPHMPLPTTSPSSNMLRISAPSLMMSLRKRDTLAPFPGQMLNDSLGLSSHRRLASFQNQANQANIVSSKISPIPPRREMDSVPSTATLTPPSFPAHGAPLQLYPSSSPISPLDHRRLSETSRKPTGPYQSNPTNGQGWWSVLKETTATQSTLASALDWPRVVAFMGELAMQLRNCSGLTALGQYRSGSTTIYSSGSSENILQTTIRTGRGGEPKSYKMEESIARRGDYGSKAIQCPMEYPVNLTRTCLSNSRTSPLKLQGPAQTQNIPTVWTTLTQWRPYSAPHESIRKTRISPGSLFILVSNGIWTRTQSASWI